MVKERDKEEKLRLSDFNELVERGFTNYNTFDHGENRSDIVDGEGSESESEEEDEA